MAGAKKLTTKVRLLVPIAGTRNGQDWPAVGESVELPSLEADDLIQSGHAERA